MIFNSNKVIEKALYRITEFIEYKSISHFNLIMNNCDCMEIFNGDDCIRIFQNGYMDVEFYDGGEKSLYCFDFNQDKVLFKSKFDFSLRTKFRSTYLGRNRMFFDITKAVPKELLNEYKNMYISLNGV